MPGNEITGAAALVTGASRGFGSGIAAALSKAGANVVGVARDRGPLVGQAIVDLTGPAWDQDAYLITAAGLRPLP
jgi:NAD(P)-dependent dehydrogenase (short-subunit alcohol dehydrogenase family)